MGQNESSMSFLPVYIIGTAFSGSTLLGNALNALDEVSYVGEVSRLPGFDIGLPESTCLLCLSRGQRCPLWCTDGVAAVKAAGPARALEELARRSASRVVVDGSKHVRWLWASAARTPGARILHAIRSPFAFVDTTQRVNGYATFEAANIWRDTIADAIRSINMAGIPSMVVRYEELAYEPERILRGVCDFLDVDFSHDALSFWDHDVHAVGGNPGAYAWYPGFAAWHEHLIRRLSTGEVVADELPDATQAFLRKEGIRVSEVDSSDFHGTVRSYSQRKFGGWVDAKWRQRLDAADIGDVMRTPALTELASLVGYDLAGLLSP